MIPTVLQGQYTNSGPLTRSLNLGFEVRNQDHYETVYRFKNWCASADGWVEYTAGTWTATGNDTPLDSNGYPTNVPEGTVTRSGVQAVWTEDGNGGRNQGTFPSGSYVFTYSGTAGSIEVKGDHITVTSTAAGRIEFTNPGTEDVYIEISGAVSGLADFVMCEAAYEGEWEAGDYWRPGGLIDLAGTKCIQFGSWNICAGWPTTNPPPTWAQRSTVDWYGFYNNPAGSHGDRWTAGSDFREMPYELQIDLVNQLGCNCWINLPYWADEDFTTSLASLLGQQLHSDAIIYVEYCVEPFFDGSVASPPNYCCEYLYDIGVAEGDTNPQVDQYAKRAAEVFGWFKTALYGRDVRAVVISSVNDTFSAFRSGWIANLVAHINTGTVKPDLWASSIYPGSLVTPSGGGMNKTWAQWVSASVQDVNDYLNDDLLYKLNELDDLISTVSDTGLPMGMYEFGFTAGATDYWGGDEVEADTIGDLMRSAMASEDAYWRHIYTMNALHDKCSEMLIYHSAAAHWGNNVPWGSVNTLQDIGRFSPPGDGSIFDHPRYYAIKSFLTMNVEPDRFHGMVNSTPLVEWPK